MKLYVIRHAEAVPLGERGITNDDDRMLTENGEEQCRAIAKGLQRHGVALEVIVTSPLVRARQTADGIVRHWTAPAPEIQIGDELAPEGSKKRLARFLRRLGKEHVGVVGHQPDLGELTAWLIGGRKAQFDLAKAGVACLEFDGKLGKGNGALVWQVTPKWCGEQG